MKHRLCMECRVVSSLPRERYCQRCRKVVLEKLRRENGYDELIRVRTLSRQGTEMIGRRCFSVERSTA